VLALIADRVSARRRTLIFTPNPEFLVYGYHHPAFVRVLNQADLNLPDGVGIVLWQYLLRAWQGRQINGLRRIPGSILTEKLLNLANEKRWRIGLAGGRRGDKTQQVVQIKKLASLYPNLKIENLDLIKNLKSKIKNFDLVFACHGMVKQERWILVNRDRFPGAVFLGLGGSLDYLTGFAFPPPVWIRRGGGEWLWRLLTRSGHLRRVLRAGLEFSWLMLKST
jgi:N-acetylglucosaminyldiphosphoundecaprenol N-acetyl-beta-D-mannosaminyltransferase